MVSTTRGAARQTPAARRSTEQPPQKKRRASPAAPAAGTAEEPIKADSSSEYDSSSDGEGVETRPCRPAERPKKRAAATRERPKNKKTRTGGGTVVYSWHELNTWLQRPAVAATAEGEIERVKERASRNGKYIALAIRVELRRLPPGDPKATASLGVGVDDVFKVSRLAKAGDLHAPLKNA